MCSGTDAIWGMTPAAFVVFWCFMAYFAACIGWIICVLFRNALIRGRMRHEQNY